MINPESLNELRRQLEIYRSEYLASLDPEVIDGSKAIDSTVQDFIEALEREDWKKARSEDFALSRQTSDAFYSHPKSLFEVKNTIHKLLRKLPKL